MMLVGFDRRDLGMLSNLFRMTLGDRYLGSALGLTWAVLSPLLLMGIFTFVFTVVFPGRLPGREGSLPFVVWLLSGYGPWLAISEGLSAATSSVVSNSGIVKNIAFKSELLPVVGALIGVMPLIVSFVAVLILQIVSGELPAIGYPSLPMIVLLHIVFVSGLGLFLEALNVFVRDTSLALPNVLTVLLFASPIFYPITAYPGLRPAGLATQSLLCHRRVLSHSDRRRLDAQRVDDRLFGGGRGGSVPRWAVVVSPPQVILRHAAVAGFEAR